VFVKQGIHNVKAGVELLGGTPCFAYGMLNALVRVRDDLHR
jgi:hypothetical protein